jgi:hypothetical protein
MAGIKKFNQRPITINFSNVSAPREHLTFAAKLEIGVRSQESGGKRKKEEGRSQKKCFYKYEMLPAPLLEFLSCCAFKLYVEGGSSCPPHKSENLFYHAI